MSKKKAGAGRSLGRATGRQRRVVARHGRPEIHADDVLGPGMTRADDATIVAALDRFDPDRPWSQARRDVRPMLPRMRPFPFPVEPLRTMLPPGILVGFGIDLGPALTMIDAGQLERWQVDLGTLVAAALDNVRGLAAACDPAIMVLELVAGVPASALRTGSGIAASMLLVPDTLERFFGPGPVLLLAPMRDLLIGLPASVDRDLAAWLAEEWESLDPNHLHLGGWRFEDGSLTAVQIEDAFARA